MLGRDFTVQIYFFIGRAEDAGGLEDPALAHVQHQPPSALDPRRLECGGGDGVPARDPSVSVSEKRLCNFVSHGIYSYVDLLQAGGVAVRRAACS